MTQERPRVRIEKKQYFDQNIWDMSIDITYFVLDILQVVISRSTYYISFERMCLTVRREELLTFAGNIFTKHGFKDIYLIPWLKISSILDWVIIIKIEYYS